MYLFENGENIYFYIYFNGFQLFNLESELAVFLLFSLPTTVSDRLQKEKVRRRPDEIK